MNADRLSPKMMHRLNEIAHQYGRDAMDADDILSEILEALTRLSSDDDSPSRIFTKARWVALSHVRSERVYTKYVGSQSEAEVSFVEDDEEEVEVHFADSLTPEQEVEHLEMAAALEAAINALPDDTDQKIVRLLKDGYLPADIAKKLDVSRSAISQRMAKIAKQFTLFGFSA